jgi:putative ATP-binding cassette transporter
MAPTKLRFIKDSWLILKGFWLSSLKWKALAMLLVATILNFSMVYISVKINYINRDLYNAIQEMDQVLFIKKIYKFLILLAPFLFIFVARSYLVSLLTFTWRQWLTSIYLHNWGKNNTFYHVLSEDNHVDNPDQRIAADLALVTESVISFFILVLGEIATLISFITILWGLSENISFNFFKHQTEIPGYLVWVALIYAIIGTTITVFTGKKLVLFDFNQEKLEANFRRALIKIQEKREEIAFYNSIKKEEKNLLQNFYMIRENFLLIIKQKVYLNIVTVTYNNLGGVFPLIVCAPLFFTKVINLGIMMQISIAFDKVKDSLSIIVSNFESLASLKASLNRLIEFNHNIENANQKFKNNQIKISNSNFPIIKVKNLTILKPNNEVLLNKLNLSIQKGTKSLLTGSSGSGKTTLARAIRGLWKYGNGDIEIASNSIFISQKPFLPYGKLIDAISYPQIKNEDKKLLTRLLNEFSLSHLVKQLDESNDWENVLSMGEQQRLVIVRTILSKPDVAIMDEPTASLDKDMENKALNILFSELTNTTFLVISHSNDIKKHFDQIIDIKAL